MAAPPPRPLVHLELHTGDLTGACAFLARLCGWRPERIDAGCGSYWMLGSGSRAPSAGVVECPVPRPLWLPYVEVGDIGQATGRARELGASLLLEPREGPAGWRSVVSGPAGGQLALWQPKQIRRPLNSDGARDG